MVMCRDCDQEMNTAATCTAEVLAIGGARYRRQRYRTAHRTWPATTAVSPPAACTTSAATWSAARPAAGS